MHVTRSGTVHTRIAQRSANCLEPASRHWCPRSHQRLFRSGWRAPRQPNLSTAPAYACPLDATAWLVQWPTKLTARWTSTTA
jgi:hypothetical protein